MNLRADDLLPIEMLASRLQATRSQTMMFEKLIDSEKFAGLGQLAANVAHHLNNPLTVILGYASLLEETVAPGAPERKGVESILSESRRMRSTLESLSRISRPQTDQLAAVSVSEMLADMGQLYRNDFLQRSIEFRMNIAPGLPRVLCSSHQLRQAVLHCLQYSISAVESHGSGLATGPTRDHPSGSHERRATGADHGGPHGCGIRKSRARLRSVYAGPGVRRDRRAGLKPVRNDSARSQRAGLGREP